MSKRIQMSSTDRFGRLRFQADLPSKGGVRYARFTCDCGQTPAIRLHEVRYGHVRSCGCLSDEVRRSHYKHGETRGGTASPEFKAWLAMRRRCSDTNNKSFHLYGARGIKVCREWSADFSAFLASVGRKPTPLHTLERIDNDGNYEPGNVRWATISEQNRNRRGNRRLTLNGVTLVLRAWSEVTGLHEAAIRSRLRYGWTVEKALTTPSGARP